MSITLHETPSEKMSPVKEEQEEVIASESAPKVSAASDYMERLQKGAVDGQIVSLKDFYWNLEGPLGKCYLCCNYDCC